MSKESKATYKDIQFSKIEFSYQSGFEHDWSKVLAGILMQEIKENMEQSGALDD